MTDTQRLSKLLSLILRHRPDEFGLNMDAYGFIPMTDLVGAVQERYKDVTVEDIRALVEDADQARFEISESGMRALYGHSFFVEMDGDPMDPPDILYMGSTAGSARKMKSEGARPVDRFYLHLSLSREVAESRSRQIGTPCVVEILARKAHEEEEIEFYARGEIVLSLQIPASCIGEISGLEGGTEPAERERTQGRSRSRGGATSTPSQKSAPARSEKPAPAAPAEPPASFGRKPRRSTGYGRR